MMISMNVFGEGLEIHVGRKELTVRRFFCLETKGSSLTCMELAPRGVSAAGRMAASHPRPAAPDDLGGRRRSGARRRLGITRTGGPSESNGPT